MNFSALRIAILAVASFAALLAPNLAGAVPLFARQTGLSCASCHFGGNYFELTKTGRAFKLGGYTAGNRQTIPLAGMVMLSDTKLANHNGYPDSAFPRDGDVIAQQISLFTGGKITDTLGAFVQWTSSPGISNDGVTVKYHSGIDNTDLRFADKTKVGGKDLIYGLSLNNNPTVQDVFNTVPAWGFPMAAPAGGNLPNPDSVAGTLIDGGLAAQTVGFGAYLDWNDLLYGELSGYQTADGFFSFMRAGQDTASPGGVKVLSGTNPYWRLALHGDSGPHSWEVGTYGLVADVYPNNLDPTGPTNRFKDYALDGQYQYAKGVHRWSAQATWIHEKVDWNASFPAAAADNPSDTQNTWRLKGSYMYKSKIGGTVGLFSTTGGTDATLYGTTSGTPDTRGYILEADYLPLQNIKLALQYTAYNKFNGSSTNYDGTGRNASDNNTWYLLGWILF